MSDNKFSKEKFIGFANAIGNATKSTVNTIGTATKNAAVTVAENVKESSEQLGKQIDQMKYDNDKKRLCPIFENEINSPDFRLPYLIRIVNDDKRRTNIACEGAIGFYTGKDIKLFNIFREFVPMLNLNFYPILEEAVYYADPCHSNLYINLNDYFTYLKKVRVDELTQIAQNLGAKHVEIVLKESKSSASSQNANANMKFKKTVKVSAEASVSKSQNEFTNLEVAAKIDFSGNEKPTKPTPVYFKNESDINALIDMRMNPDNQNKILSKTYSIKYGNTSGIKVSDAEKIDASLANIGCSMSRSVTSEALSESNTILEYSITF